MNEPQCDLEVENRNLKIVSQFTMDILSASSESEVMELLADTLLNQIDIDKLELYTLDSSQRNLQQIKSFINKQPLLLDVYEPKIIELGQGLIGKVAKSLQTQNIHNLKKLKEYKNENTEHVSALVVPIETDGKLIGVINCACHKEAAFSEQIEKSLVAMASITAIKLEKSRAIEQLQHTVDKLEYSGKIQDTLFEIAELIFETSNMQEFYQRLHSCIGKLMFASNFFVALVIEDGQAITLPYAVDEVDDVPPNEIIPLDNEKPSITGYVLNTNEPLLATKRTMQTMIDSNQVYIKGSLPNAWLGVPFGEAPLHGVVVVQSYNADISFTEKDKQLLCFVARHIRNAIERIQARADLQFLALHDPLTKLSNRSLFNDRVDHALHKCKREKNKKIALLFLDLDKFKQVNDTYGHHVGDLLLIDVAQRIKGCIRESDTLARLGGDEFAILLEEIGSSEQTEKVADKIIKSLREPFILDKIQINTSTSIGIAFNEDEQNSTEALIICADEAMYQAKQQGRNRAVLHKGSAQLARVATKVIEQEALEGLRQNQFFFMFQPIADLATGNIVGAEALVRWKTPKGKILPSGAFLNEMLENGSIVQLDIYNVLLALKHIRMWLHLLPPKFRLSVNISSLSFSSTTLLDVVQTQFDKEPELLKHLSLETTEKSIVRSVELTRAQMKVFSKMGIKLVLDDYGTGYSSLGYLGQFKFDYIKIDRSFVCDYETNPERSIILESINSLARSLAIKTVAEGIETQEQLKLMQDIECSLGQGFYISKLLNETELLELLQSKHKLLVV